VDGSAVELLTRPQLAQPIKRFKKCCVARLSAGRVFGYWLQESDTT